jgi:SAM-dependent methyltransferase
VTGCDSEPVRSDYFGESVAARYDEPGTGMFAPEVVEPAAGFLEALARAGGGPEPSALELGIGTGRIALPLSQRGVLVHGIDLSAAMVARLRAKPGAGQITVTVGDFATARTGRTYGLVYLVFNTIMNLTTQDDQVECFRIRYAWPAELDLMARIAGMTLLERWADFTREPFTSESTSHVSVWRKTAH